MIRPYHLYDPWKCVHGGWWYLEKLEKEGVILTLPLFTGQRDMGAWEHGNL